MKKLAGFALVTMILLVSFGTTSAATNYEHKAMNAARQAGCFDGYEVKNTWVTVETTSACFAGGFIMTANIIYRPTVVCPDPTMGCPTPMPIVISSVQFGCDDEIMSVNCD